MALNIGRFNVSKKNRNGSVIYSTGAKTNLTNGLTSGSELSSPMTMTKHKIFGLDGNYAEKDINGDAIIEGSLTVQGNLNVKALQIENAFIASLTSNTVNTKTLYANSAQLKEFFSDKGNITNLTADTINANDIVSKSIEVDELTAKSAHFFELIIDQLRSSQGQVILSAANLRVDYLKTLDDGTYRLCQLKDDGKRKIDNQFMVGDQVICQKFNVREGVSYNVSNKYYWALVTNTGNINYEGTDYIFIDLDKTTYDGYLNPDIGDELAQLGYRGTAGDMSKRQCAIILSAYNSPDRNVKAPSIVQYKGINSFTLDGCIMNQLAANGNIFKGDFYTSAGTDITSILDGNDDRYNEYKAQLEALQALYNALKGTVDDLDGGDYQALIDELTSLKNKVDGNSDSITELIASYSSLSNTVTGLSSTVVSIQKAIEEGESVEALAARVSTLENGVNGLKSEVLGLRTDIDKNTNDITGLTASVSTLTNDYTGLTATVTTIQQGLDTVSGDTAQLKIKADEISSKVTNYTSINLLSGLGSGTGWVYNKAETNNLILNHRVYKFVDTNDSYIRTPPVMLNTNTTYTLSWFDGVPKNSKVGVYRVSDMASYLKDKSMSYLSKLKDVSVVTDTTKNGRYYINIKPSNENIVFIWYFDESYSYISKPQLEVGTTPTDFNLFTPNISSEIRQTADEIKLAVEDTGIDITNKKIELNADNTVINGNLNISNKEGCKGIIVRDREDIERLRISTDSLTYTDEYSDYSFTSDVSMTNATSLTRTFTIDGFESGKYLGFTSNIELLNFANSVTGSAVVTFNKSGDNTVLYTAHNASITKTDNGYEIPVRGKGAYLSYTGAIVVKIECTFSSGITNRNAYIRFRMSKPSERYAYIAPDGFYFNTGEYKNQISYKDNDFTVRTNYAGLKIDSNYVRTLVRDRSNNDVWTASRSMVRLAAAGVGDVASPDRDFYNGYGNKTYDLSAAEFAGHKIYIIKATIKSSTSAIYKADGGYIGSNDSLTINDNRMAIYDGTAWFVF